MELRKTDILIFILLIAAITMHFVPFGKTRIGFIRNQEVVYRYKGMQDAHLKLNEKASYWKSGIDSLEKNIQHHVNIYNTSSGMAATEKKILEEKLNKQRQELYRYKTAVEQKYRAEDDKLSQGVLNQINSFVEAYGKKNGYDIILGTTNSGNLMYGKIGIDLTEEIIKELNATQRK
jgi:outer membrane protein